MKKDYDLLNENSIYTEEDARDFLDEFNYAYSLDDDLITNEFEGSIKIENIFW